MKTSTYLLVPLVVPVSAHERQPPPPDPTHPLPKPEPWRGRKVALVASFWSKGLSVVGISTSPRYPVTPPEHACQDGLFRIRELSAQLHIVLGRYSRLQEEGISA
jgi:hypothetical protein